MSTNAQAVTTLLLFNEKAERLEKSRFITTLLSEESGVRFHFSQDSVVSERYGPDQEAIEAFTLTYRFFIQNNEPTSLSKMATLYQTLPVDPSLIAQFLTIRQEINQLLDSQPLMTITINDQTFTNRDIWDTFIYGGLAHAKPLKKQLFDSWKAMPLVFDFLEYIVIRLFAFTTKGILLIRAVNLKVLDQMSANNT